ncbi:branched-chain amino acid ABC transporter permease [Lottiidibacillus patelloidae]|uniref:Branched-chain amino acid ABC transporter permease n=1 Tax=Lottiidibacillus patelloidae TaxID=2670334 RepID=A0A263BX89_9BACI|nr:branched-chain amino acid ABC transporter permease [Lottiidibacillus patelloidae]OZM58371.1 branched-chain amino acid ABC transporter permease [Lottiidibacillus patelloidae]
MIKNVSKYKIITYLIIAYLIALPFVSDSRSTLLLLTQVFIFAIFAMSYDLLLGYTGIVSFGHAMFFGIGAYTTGVYMKDISSSLGSYFISVALGMLFAAIVSFLVGILSLRLKSHFYAMLTLAFAGLFLVLAEKWRTVTRGNDGFTFNVPEVMYDRVVFYFIVFAAMIGVYLLLKRFTSSPLGHVLQATRENEQRTESLGYNVLTYRVISSVVAGMLAAFSGSLYVITLRFVNTSVFATEVTLNALLMTIIGGVGTLVGAIIGAGLFEFAHHWLSDLAKVHWIFERWIILFGTLYILIVMFLPYGVVGTFRKWRFDRSVKKQVKLIEKVNDNKSV